MNKSIAEFCKRHDLVQENVEKLAQKLGLKIHICHLSTEQGLELIREAKEDGVDITCEVTPHHLFFDVDNRKEFERNAFLKMNPPLRTKNDRLALLEGLKSGDIDVLATDHAPHTIEEKQSSNPSGVPMLDTYGLFVTWLINEHKFSLQNVVDFTSKNPAKLLGLNQGVIMAGKPANLSVLNLEAQTKFVKEMVKSKCGWSPFEGFTFPGRVEATILRGKIHYNGKE